MKLQEASDYFEGLKNETTKKDEIRIYEKFLHILSGLKVKEFSKDEIQSIEAELDRLDLKSNAEYGKKYFQKALSQFKNYLRNTFSFISKGHYTNLGIGLGSSFGILLGIVVLSGFERSLGISAGLIIGMLIGLAIGSNMDAQAKTAGKVL